MKGQVATIMPFLPANYSLQRSDSSDRGHFRFRLALSAALLFPTRPRSLAFIATSTAEGDINATPNGPHFDPVAEKHHVYQGSKPPEEDLFGGTEDDCAAIGAGDSYGKPIKSHNSGPAFLNFVH